MKKKKPAKKRAPAKKKAKALKKAKPVKKKKVAKKAKATKKKRVVKKAKALKKAKPAKKVKAAKKAKPKKAAVKKVKAVKKAAPKKAKAPKKPAAPKKPKAALPATPAIQELQKQKVVFSVCSCQYTDTDSIQQAAAELHVDPHCIIKTVVMEDELGKPMLVLMHGDQDVSAEELAATVGAQQISACSPELTEVHTGYEAAAISPFGIKKVMPAFMEKSIAMMPEIYIGAGQRGLMAKMKPEELIDTLKPFMVSVAK